MKKALCITAAAAVVAACASPQASTESRGSAAPARASAAYYCAKEKLNPQGDRLECNWQPTADEACRFFNSSALSRASLSTDPQPAGRCNTGDWLVKVSPR